MWGNIAVTYPAENQSSLMLDWGTLVEVAIHAVKKPGVLRRFDFEVERKKGRADCEGNHSKKTPGMDLPYTLRW